MSALTSGEVLSVRVVVDLLSPTLGAEKSLEVVAAAGKRLGVTDETITTAQASSILEEIARTPGIVGVTARFARSRTDFSRFSRPSQRPLRPVSDPPPPLGRPATIPPARAAAVTTIPVGELAALLAHTIGQEKSEEAILGVIQRRGFPAEALDKEQATLVFEDLARLPGLVGITARFTKSRIAARFGG